MHAVPDALSRYLQNTLLVIIVRCKDYAKQDGFLRSLWSESS